MTEFLEVAALVVWIGVGLYVWSSTRRLTRRMDDALDKLDASFKQKEGNGPW